MDLMKNTFSRFATFRSNLFTSLRLLAFTGRRAPSLLLAQPSQAAGKPLRIQSGAWPHTFSHSSHTGDKMIVLSSEAQLNVHGAECE